MKKLIIILLLAIANSLSAYQYTIVCYSDYDYASGQYNVSCYITEEPCSIQPSFYIIGQLAYCKEFNAISVHPTIFVDGSGGAVLSDNGRTVRIQPDELKNFVEKSKIKLANGSLSKEAFQNELAKLTKTDAGKVSKERLAKIMKDLGAKIIEVKQLPEPNFCPACTTETNPDEKKSGLKDALKTHAVLSLGGGFSNPNAAFKNANNMGNFSQFNANVYVPIFQYGGATGGVVNYGGATGGVISFGINGGIEYFAGNKAYNLAMYSPYQVTGQTASPTTAAKGSGSPKQAGFKTEAGIQANYTIGNFTLSPILNAAYISLKQEAFEITQTSSVNGQMRDFALYSQPENKTSGMGIIPKIRLGYQFGGNRNFGMYAEAGYLFGPSVHTEYRLYQPDGKPNDQGNYSIDQMLNGKNLSQTQKANFNVFSLNVGVSYTIKSHVKSNDDGQSSNLQNSRNGGGTDKVNIQDLTLIRKNPNGRAVAPTRVKCNCGRDIYGKDEAACRRICRFLKDGTYINGKAVFSPEELQKIKNEYLDGFFVVIDGNKELDPALFKEITNTAGLREQKVSVTNPVNKKSYAFSGNQDDLVKILTIPTARAQECTDCKDSDNCENSGHYDCCCNNGYCWCLLCIVKTTLSPLPDEKITGTGSGTTTGHPVSEKSISSKAVKRSDLNYTEDYSVQDKATLEFLNTQSLIIKKGSYQADFSQNPFGTITLTLSSQVDAKGITEKGIKRMAGSGYHCDRDCKEEKDVCWTCKTGVAQSLYYYFTLEPVIEDGMISKIKIVNNKVVLGDKVLTAAAYQELINVKR